MSLKNCQSLNEFKLEFKNLRNIQSSVSLKHIFIIIFQFIDLNICIYLCKFIYIVM